jgi:hypothetical protein
MAVYETKIFGHGPSRKSINRIMATYKTKIADHIIQGPHIRLAIRSTMWLQIRFTNPVGATPLWWCSNTGTFQDHKSGSQILFAMCKSGTQTRWVLPRRDSTPNRRQIHRISPLPNMAIYYTDIQMKSITLAHRAVWPPTRRKPKSHACLQKLYFNRTR